MKISKFSANFLPKFTHVLLRISGCEGFLVIKLARGTSADVSPNVDLNHFPRRWMVPEIKRLK